jgi:hypothetical protein
MPTKVAAFSKTVAISRSRTVSRQLHWYASLAGEVAAKCAPLGGCDAKDEAATGMYRYDWAFGLACASEKGTWWDWLRETESVSVHLLVKCPGGVTFSEESADLLALFPSRDTRTWLERSGATAITALGGLASGLGDVLPGAKSGSKGLAMLAKAVPSHERAKGKDHAKWFIYRFFDVEEQACAIEWNIAHAVLEEYGPMLRGSAILRFHGAPETAEKARLSLRAGILFTGSPPLEWKRPAMEQGSEMSPQVALDLQLT